MGETAGRAFAAALAAKDWDAARDLLDPEVDFRALTPRRFWEASGAGAVVEEVIDEWFGDDEISGLLSVAEGEPVGDRRQVSYRLGVAGPDGPEVVEQQAYYEVGERGITWIRILCSGPQPAPRR